MLGVAESMQALIDQGNVLLGKYHKDRDDWTINYRVPKKNTRKLKTVWWDKSHDAGTHGTEMLKKFLGQPGLFPFRSRYTPFETASPPWSATVRRIDRRFFRGFRHYVACDLTAQR